MRYANLSLCLLALGLGPARVLCSIRREFGRRNVQVAEVTPGAVIDYEEHEINFHTSGSDFEDSLRCNPRLGKRLTLSADRQWAACCRPGESLLGSPQTAFDCCQPGQILAGSRQTGYACSPAGNVYDDYNAVYEQGRRGQAFRGYGIYDDHDDVYGQRRPRHGLGGRGRQGEGMTPATRCPPGQPWRDGSCLLPINDCADRAHPELGDTSYNPADFPCSAGRERPCRGHQVQDWQSATLYWMGSHQQPGAPQPYETVVDFDSDVIMTLVDVETQGGHYLVRLDGILLGETGGEKGYRNAFVGYYNDPEWCLMNGYSRGYFRIPRGRHTITIEWPQGTGRYRDDSGSNQGYGIAKYRFDRLCNPNKCVPNCVEAKRDEAERARQTLRQQGRWPPHGGPSAQYILGEDIWAYGPHY
ncbi:hypothetical protein MFIFM68171_05548 [Madurella fahalii]|uniref:Uncharacterized protein n=1 Tax=Madurella fahalii TaxID=1157608 RepID=A0ABQ0GC66_9PEZI